MNSSRSPAHKGLVGAAVGVGSGLVIAVPAVLAAIISAGAGHGSYVAAQVLFPIPALLLAVGSRVGLAALTVGILQFPLYGAIVGRNIGLGRFGASMLLAMAHLAAVLVCFSGLLSPLR